MNYSRCICICDIYTQQTNFYFHSMFQELNGSYLKRQLKTSEPRFKRLPRSNTGQQEKNSTHSNFPQLNKGNAFDSSKQNLYYESHLTKVRSACKLDEASIVSRYLNTIRKDFDDMSKVSRRQLASMKLKKREIDFIKMKNQVFTEKRQQLEKIIAQKQQQTLEVKEKYEDSKMQTKTLENIIARMKKDQIFYKQFGRIRDEELKKKIKETKALDENLIHQEEKLHKLMSTLNDCKSLYIKNKQLREKKYQDFSGKISDVKQRDKFIQQRKERTYELQSIELNDTLDEKNIHMRQIILAHKVADSLLEGKVNTLIKRYSDIQNAFHLVKIKTCISEPHLLTSKFFSYEQTAESLLESITEHQQTIQKLLARKQFLSEQHKNLVTQNLSISDGRGLHDNEDMYQKKQSLVRQINQKKLLEDQIFTWIDKRLIEFHSEESNKTQPLEEKFQLLCHYLTENIQKYEQIDLGDRKANIMGVRMKKLVKELSAEQLSLRLRESEEMNESNAAEEQFIKTSRQNLMKKGFNIKHIKRDSATNK